MIVLWLSSTSYSQSIKTEEIPKLFTIVQDQKIGYIDKTGKVVIKPQFDFAENFSEGFARVFLSGKWGYIDTKGKYLVNLQFESAADFSEGFGAVKKDGKWGFIDSNGKIAIRFQFEGHFSYSQFPPKFSEGLAAVISEGKFGYIDKSGKFVIKPQFFHANDFKDGLARVVIGIGGPDSKLAYINKEGNYVWGPSR
jgi:hypothetical protein